MSKRKTPRRERYYGLIKIKSGTKFCWVSMQNKHGWSLGFALGNHTFYLRNVRFASSQEVRRAISRSKVVFIGLKHSGRK